MPRPGEEGHWRNFASSRRIAWKTGTSWGLRDGWAVGNTSRHTVAVWVGNASGEGRPGLTGSTMAAPLMFALFNSLPASPWFELPMHALRRIDTCENDGFLATGCLRRDAQPGCRATATSTRSVLTTCASISMPMANNVCDSDCESPGRMTQASWFVLPPAEEFYYRRVHAEYRPLPALRADCAATRTGGRPALALLYPDRELAGADPAGARRTAADARFSRQFTDGGKRRSTGISMTDTLGKRTLFTSNRWTSTPASTY